jgi:cytochrome P450
VTRTDVKFFHPSTRSNPYPYYKELRRRTPVLEVPSFGQLVSRRKDVLFLLNRPEVFSSSAVAGADTTLLGRDPPSHTRVRRIVNRLFSRDKVFAAESGIRESAERLIAGVSREWDLVRDFAVPFPLLVMAQKLGVERERWRDLKRWTHAAVSPKNGSRAAPEPELALAEFDSFFRSLIERRRERPGNDAISVLLHPQDESDELTDGEALSFSKLLLMAGGETTTNLIGNAVLVLLGNPVAFDAVVSDPSLVPALVEETLRYDPPVQFVLRNTTEEVVLGDSVIPANARVAALLASANRDEEFFSNSDRFDLKRPYQINAAFGVGVHYCLGAALARTEARIALETLVPVLARFKAAEDLNEIPLVDSIQLRGPKRLLLISR